MFPAIIYSTTLQKLGTLLINMFIQSIHHLIQLHHLVQPLSDSFMTFRYILPLLLCRVVVRRLKYKLTVSPNPPTDPVEWYLELLIEPSLDSDELALKADIVCLVIVLSRRAECKYNRRHKQCDMVRDRRVNAYFRRREDK